MKKLIKLMLVLGAMLITLIFAKNETFAANNQYKGNINSEVKSISLNQDKNGNYYFSGEIVIVEWINGKSTVPQSKPKITFYNEAGDKLEAFVTPTGTNTYYFDRFISYYGNACYFEVELTEANNTSEYKSMIMPLEKFNNKSIGKMVEYGKYLKLVIKKNVIEKEEIKETVNTEVKKIEMKQDAKGNHYICGEIVVVKWEDGVSTVPTSKPILYMYGSGIREECFVTPTGTNTYYFDKFVEGTVQGHKGHFEITVTDAKVREQYVYLENTKLNGKELGIIKDLNVGVENRLRVSIKGNDIVFESSKYTGDINSELKKLELTKNEYNEQFICGEIVVVEWVNGKSTVPRKKPKITFCNSLGEKLEAFVTPTGTNTYYFDRNIAIINEDTEYYITVELTDEDNISEHKRMQINFGKLNNKNLGYRRCTNTFYKSGKNYGKEYWIKTKDNKIIFEEITDAVG